MTGLLTTGLLTEEEVHSTPDVAEWLRNQLAAEAPLAADIDAANRLMLANYQICRVRYAQALETTRNPLTVYQSYVELRQAAWAIRVNAWIYRGREGWRDEWFDYDLEAVGATR